MVRISRRQGFQLMLGASHMVLLGAGVAGQAIPQSYNGRVDLLSPISHWPLATLKDRKSASEVVAFGSHETGLPPIARLDGSGASRGFNGVDAYGTIEDKPSYAVPAGGVFVLMQPNTIAAKMQVFNSGILAPGSMALEVEPNGRPRAYRIRSDGTAVVITGSVGQIAVGTPYLYGVTWGPSGLRLWLMDEKLQPGLVASNSETDWATITDTSTKFLGRWSGSAVDFFDGVLGHLQFYGIELNQAQIESLALPQLVVQPQRAYTVPVAPSDPPGSAIYVAIGGDDMTGDGSIDSPYGTIAKALSVAANGSTVVLRKGIYRGEANLNVNVSNLTIKGYRPDIEANPLDPGNWPIIDGCFNPASMTWDLVHDGRQEYRTTSTNLGTDTPQGMIVPGLSHQFPRWEPLTGYHNPTPMYRLWPYQGTSGVRSLQAFRQTGTVAFGDRNCYLGPGLYRMGDGRIHIRLQPIDPSVNGGEAIDGVPDKHPDNNQIFLWQKDSVLFASLSNGIKIQGVFVRGYDRIYHNAPGRNNVELTRCVFWMGAFQNYWWLTSSGHTGFLFQHNLLEGGHCIWWPFRLIKTNLPNGGANYGRITPFNFNGGGTYNATLEDNIITGVSDVVVATSESLSASSTLKIRYNCVFNVQDMEQVSHSWHNREVAYNFIKGVMASYQGPGNSMPNSTACHYHHNICVWNHLQINEPGQRLAWEITCTHQSGSGWRAKTYYNTIIFSNPGENGSRASKMERPTMGWSQSGDPHESWNNIYILWNRVAPGQVGATSHTHLYEAMHTNEPSKKWLSDGNGFFVFKDTAVGSNSLFKKVRSNASASPVTFDSLSAFRSHAYYNASIGNYGYSDGMETNSVQGDPDFVGVDVEKLDVLSNPPSAYRPQASNYKTGAVNITGRGLPGAGTHQPWRGAIDPDGDGSDVGPRQATS